MLRQESDEKIDDDVFVVGASSLMPSPTVLAGGDGTHVRKSTAAIDVVIQDI